MSKIKQTTPLLEVRNLSMSFPLPKPAPDGRRTFKAVSGATFNVAENETLALVGESGCGKTTLGRCLVRIYEPTEGNILFRLNLGQGQETVIDLVDTDKADLRVARQQIRMIFQDPFSSLNPRMTVGTILAEGMLLSGRYDKKTIRDRVAYLLERVGLRADYMSRYPHAFSGGQRQRVVIARALALEPRMVIADEAVSALDVSVRAQVLALMRELQEQLGLTYIFISHDLSVVEYIADRVVVMYLGEMVEIAPTAELYNRPRHPYTEALLAAIPIPDPNARAISSALKGDIPDPRHPPSGCRFHPRCPYAQELCRTTVPELRDEGSERSVACHFAEQLSLVGA